MRSRTSPRSPSFRRSRQKAAARACCCSRCSRISARHARAGARVADGFLTLFGTKLILPGVADQRTLETISTALGEYDRKVVTETQGAGPESAGRTQRSFSHSTQRTRVLSPGEVANIPAGHALHLDGVRWELVTLTPVHAPHSPFEAVVHAR